MTITDYYRILDLTPGVSVNEIKKAYREKARLYHPDINKSPDAQELFISATEAYDFLISYHDKISKPNVDSQIMDDWQKQSREWSRRKAYAYAQESYSSFKKSNYYKTTRMFEGITVIFGFIISVLIIIYAIAGYFYRLSHPIPEMEEPSVFAFIMFLVTGFLFLLVSLAFLLNHFRSLSKKRKR